MAHCPATYIRRGKMRHFLVVVGSVAANFILWALITFLPVHQMIIICLSIGVGCLMLYSIVHFGGAKENASSTQR
jgi:5-bromo-4-chloroindolyl phosphate hydrolysis protein